MKGLSSEGLMRPITKGTFLRVLACAEVDRAVGLGLVRNGRKGRALVGAVAEGLALAVAAGAPVVGLAGFDKDGYRRLLRDMGGGHDEEIQDERWRIKDG
jgi:Na+(H+)/acetate symporter ActP